MCLRIVRGSVCQFSEEKNSNIFFIRWDPSHISHLTQDCMKYISHSSFDDIFPMVMTRRHHGETVPGGPPYFGHLSHGGALRFPTIIYDYIMRQIHDNISLYLTLVS